MRRVFGPAVASLIAFAILIGLGTWQMQRLAWKEDLIARIEARIVAVPITLDEVTEAFMVGEDIEYLRVQVTGSYDHRGELYMYQIGPEGPGWHVHTPLVVAPDEIVIVNRGYVPLRLREPETRPGSLIEGEVTVTGLVRGDAKKGWFGNDNDYEANEWYWRSVSNMGAEALRRIGLEKGVDGAAHAFVIDAEAGGDPGDVPLDGTTLIDLPNRHFGYALTWYGLGGTLVLVAGPFLWRRWRHA